MASERDDAHAATSSMEDPRAESRGDEPEASEGESQVPGTTQTQRDERGEGESEFVAQCRLQARQLCERRMEQERQLGELVESSFSQLEQIFNALLQAAQAEVATSHVQFEEACNQLDENLHRHQQVEAKLQAIMAILLGPSQQ